MIKSLIGNSEISLDFLYINGIIRTMNTKALSYRHDIEMAKRLENAKWNLKLSKNEIITKALTEFLFKNKC